MLTKEQQEKKVLDLISEFENDRDEGRKKNIENNGGAKKRLVNARIVTDPDKGMLSYFGNEKYPMKGSIEYHRISAAGAIKRLTLWCLRAVYKKYVRKHRVPFVELTPTVREIYRVCTVMMDRERDDQMKEKMMMLRDTITLILSDKAYESRVQDGATIVDIEKMKPDEGDLYYMHKDFRNKHYNFGGEIPQEEWDVKVEEKRKQITNSLPN